jgi:hypothetical protein
VSWDRGYQNFRSDRDIGSKTLAAVFGDNAKDPSKVEPGDYPGPWEKADVIVLDFAAVRDDVLMKIDIRGTSVDNARALMTIAMNRVAWPAKP